uniref:BESS domain-containing protein n=1 Tax=Lygus hesperus TaxID=30085 RepID=A0A146L615_LYGHE
MVSTGRTRICVPNMDFKIDMKYWSQRGKSAIVVDRFKYTQFRVKSDGAVCFRCSNRKCKVLLTTDKGITRVLSLKNEHNHEPKEDELIQREKLCSALKQKVTEDVSTEPTKLIELISAHSSQLPRHNIKLIRRTIHTARKKVTAAVPKPLDGTCEGLTRNTSSGDVTQRTTLLVPDNQHAAASSSKDAEVREHEAHLDAHVEDEPLINVPSGAEFESIVIKQEPVFGEEETTEPWAAHDPIEIPVKCETADPIQGEPPVPLDLEEDDLLYFKSLVPDLVKLTPELKDVFRMKVRNILKELTT